MNRVVGIGGIFFKCEDTEKSKEWYNKHLGIQSDQYGGCFRWYDTNGNPGHTVWSPFKKESNYFSPSTSPFMVNYRVENLEEFLPILKAEGVEIIGEPEISEYGKFAWIIDPNGIKLELWEAPSNFNDLTGVVQDSK